MCIRWGGGMLRVALWSTTPGSAGPVSRRAGATRLLSDQPSPPSQRLPVPSAVRPLLRGDLEPSASYYQ